MLLDTALGVSQELWQCSGVAGRFGTCSESGQRLILPPYSSQLQEIQKMTFNVQLL